MERRLTTIVAADIVGFSRLVGLDEEGTLAAQRAHRAEIIDPLLARHKGRLANTAGDSLLIEFPSAVEAVRFALAMQEGVEGRNSVVPEERRLRYRVGINLGDVVPEGDDLLGDGVNVAARLEALAPPGGIVISRTARDQVRDRVDAKLTDLGEVNVKNIARPVRAFQVLREGEAAMAPPKGVGKPRVAGPALIALIAAVLVVLLAGGWWYARSPDIAPADPERMAFPLPEVPSIAILPFENMSGEPGEEYFADGLTEDIITDLSRLPDIFVISRRSSFAYKDKVADLAGVAEELGVRYVLEGSARKADDRIRINVRLLDALSGRNVWGERYDRPLDDLLDVQTELSRRIVAAMDAKLVSGAMALQRREGTDKPDAFDLLIRGIREARRSTRESNTVARGMFERALSLDPGYADAKVWLARTYVWAARYGWTDDREAAIRKAEELIEGADGAGQSVMAVIHTMRKDYEAALRAREAAVAASPNSADAHARLGLTLIQIGRPEDAIPRFATAMRLSPVYPNWYLGRLGDAYRLTGRTEEAIDAFRTILARSPKDILHGRVRLVVTLMEAGQPKEARKEAEEILRINPRFTVDRYISSRLYRDPAIIEDMRSALLRAGLPEG